MQNLQIEAKKQAKDLGHSMYSVVNRPRNGDGDGNGILFHMTQPTSRSTIKAIACSKPTISEY